MSHDFIGKLKSHCPELAATYTDDRSLLLVAEAYWWSHTLGLNDFFAKMTPAEIRTFKPIEESLYGTDIPLRDMLRLIMSKMKEPAESLKASYALGQAAWCAYLWANNKKLKDLDF